MHADDAPTLKVEEISPETLLVERATCDHRDIGRVVAEALAHLARRAGRFAAGPPIVRYLDWRETDCDLEAGVPLTGEPDLFGDLTVETLPAHTAVTALHIGPYDALRGVHRAIEAWIGEHGHRALGPPWERYLDEPGDVPAESRRTLVGWPVG